jgi:hypothetical protein
MEHFFENIDGFSSYYAQGALLEKILSFFPTDEILHIVEIGVYKGRMTAMWNVHLINEGRSYNYDAIDHFMGSEEHDNNIDYFSITLDNLESILDFINIIKGESIEKSKLYEYESLDIIYIDASHDYESVKKDILTWFPKLKKDGIICGDDYCDGWPGVIKAVNEIFGKQNVSFIGGSQWYYKQGLNV